MAERLLKPSDLPDTLWRSGESMLVLPADLRRAYCRMLEDKGLMEAARNATADDGPVGGIKEEDTRRHFATRFASSSARVQLASLDPKDSLRNASDLFLKAFSGGRIGLLDIPCGAGAASAALLGCIMELRKAKVLPREPLEVFLIYGDISIYAREYAGELLTEMRAELEREGILVREKAMPWDVLNAESTTDILHAWMDWARDCHEYFVIMANFSGFLQGEGKFNDAKAQLDEIIRWAGTRRSSVLWIEPQTNMAVKGLIPRVLKWLGLKLPSRFMPTWAPETSIALSDAIFQHPVKPDYRPLVQLNLIRLEASAP